jgi:hypothetical protein
MRGLLRGDFPDIQHSPNNCFFHLRTHICPQRPESCAPTSLSLCFGSLPPFLLARVQWGFGWPALGGVGFIDLRGSVPTCVNHCELSLLQGLGTAGMGQYVPFAF